jgi:hypothetical protein
MGFCQPMMEGLKAMGMVKMHEANQQVMNDLLGLIKQRQRGSNFPSPDMLSSTPR